jgi:hypothetical protein
VDELTILREFVADEPADDAEARAEVWRRLGLRQTRRHWSQPRFVLLGGFAVALVVAIVILTVRSSGIGVAPAEAACPISASSDQCVRTLAAILLPSASGETRGGPSRIAFSLFRGGGEPTGADIYSMNSRGGDLRRLTNGSGWAAFPTWSPSGRRIAFVWRGQGAASGIYVMNPDGSGRRLLAAAPWSTPAWSPDGSKIAFWREDGIYLVERDGRGLHLVRTRGSSPSWSPDGTKIAYTLDNRIYVMNADGTDQRLLAHGSFPAWSRDGRTIAFHSTRYFVNHTNPVWIMNAEGGHQRSLHVRTWVDCQLGWSPGGQLAVSNPAGLFLLRPQGHGLTKLSGAHICGVAWQPIGRPAR